MEEKKAHDEQQQPKQPTSSTSKVSLDDFDKDDVQRTIIFQATSEEGISPST